MLFDSFLNAMKQQALIQRGIWQCRDVNNLATVRGETAVCVI